MLRTVTKPLPVLVLVLIACFADDVWGRGHGGGGRPGGGRPGGWYSTKAQCKKALALTTTEYANFTAATTLCLANQTGLLSLLTNVTNLCCGGGSDSGERYNGYRHDGGGCRKINAADLMEALGNDTGAVLYNQCMANSTGLLDSTGNVNTTALTATITNKVAAYPAIVANTKLGTTNCVVTNYNVTGYMKCVCSYCATGSAPTG